MPFWPDEAARRADPSAGARDSERALPRRAIERQPLEEGARALVGAGSGHGAHVGQFQALAAVGVDQHRLERPAVAAIDEIHRLAAARSDAKAVAPLLQPDDDGEQGSALVGQAIFMAQRTLAVGGLAEDAGLDKFLQPRRQDIARDAEIFLEVVEAAHAVEGVT